MTGERSMLCGKSNLFPLKSYWVVFDKRRTYKVSVDDLVMRVPYDMPIDYVIELAKNQWPDSYWPHEKRVTVRSDGVGRYTHRTTQVSAVRFDGSEESRVAIVGLVGDAGNVSPSGSVIVRNDGNVYRMERGDWVIKRDSGCIYTCSNESFDNNYEV
jgi:hypothetical protein